MFHFWPQNWKSVPVSSGPLYIYCIYFTLYNNRSCSCILIRSRPWSIRGQMYDWCYHYRPQASDPLYIYCIYFILQPSFFRIVNVSWHGYLKTKFKNKETKTPKTSQSSQYHRRKPCRNYCITNNIQNQKYHNVKSKKHQMQIETRVKIHSVTKFLRT